MPTLKQIIQEEFSAIRTKDGKIITGEKVDDSTRNQLTQRLKANGMNNNAGEQPKPGINATPNSQAVKEPIKQMINGQEVEILETGKDELNRQKYNAKHKGEPGKYKKFKHSEPDLGLKGTMVKENDIQSETKIDKKFWDGLRKEVDEDERTGAVYDKFNDDKPTIEKINGGILIQQRYNDKLFKFKYFGSSKKAAIADFKNKFKTFKDNVDKGIQESIEPNNTEGNRLLGGQPRTTPTDAGVTFVKDNGDGSITVRDDDGKLELWQRVEHNDSASYHIIHDDNQYEFIHSINENLSESANQFKKLVTKLILKENYQEEGREEEFDNVTSKEISFDEILQLGQNAQGEYAIASRSFISELKNGTLAKRIVKELLYHGLIKVETQDIIKSIQELFIKNKEKIKGDIYFKHLTIYVTLANDDNGTKSDIVFRVCYGKNGAVREIDAKIEKISTKASDALKNEKERIDTENEDTTTNALVNGLIKNVYDEMYMKQASAFLKGDAKDKSNGEKAKEINKKMNKKNYKPDAKFNKEMRKKK